MTAAELRNAAGLVKSTTTVSAIQSSPAPITVFLLGCAGKSRTLYGTKYSSEERVTCPLCERFFVHLAVNLSNRSKTDPAAELEGLLPAVVQGVEYQFDAAGDAKLLENSEQIFFYRVLAQAQLAGYIAVA